jgi:hypothetical protein
MTTDSEIRITGGCLCRAVRYVSFPSQAITVEGELQDFVSLADSGNRMHRSFCPDCGTPMFSAAEARPHLLFVRAGTLDDPQIAKPQMTIWTSQAPDWACFNADLPRVEGQPPPAG